MSERNYKYDVTVIGAAIADVLAHPVDAAALNVPSYPAEGITLGIGGDAANEARALAGLGKKVSLVTKFGDDMLGDMLKGHFERLGVSTEYSTTQSGIDTGINIVLVAPDGGRSFITNSNGTLRLLGADDIPDAALDAAPIVSFASIFVSPLLDIPAMSTLFSKIKACGCTLCADMTRCRHGETAEDLRPVLKYVDYLFPNQDEAAAVTGQKLPSEAAAVLLECGASCVVIKTGGAGCHIKSRDLELDIPAYPHSRCIDTTGAGDNFAAGFIYALSKGMEPAYCARFANAAASIAIESVGAFSPDVTRENVLERMKEIM